MSSNVELLDIVVLAQDSQTDQVVLRRGEMGTVVEMLAPSVYEVEFCDEFGRAYAFASLHADLLLVLHNQGKKWGKTPTPLALAA
jgi:hypothetical protein